MEIKNKVYGHLRILCLKKKKKRILCLDCQRGRTSTLEGYCGLSHSSHIFCNNVLFQIQNNMFSLNNLRKNNKRVLLCV